jgi:hypothetical protein
VTVTDILAITDKIKNRGPTRWPCKPNVLKRLFAYAIAREKTTFNRRPPSRRSSLPKPRAGT